MSRVRGIAKNISALFSGHAINTVQNLVQVPIFIHAYGAAGYGEWLTLAAAVSYLGTLDFGVQTYVNQDLTVRYHSGDMEGFHVQQSTALRLLLGIVTTAAVLALAVFAMPLQHWLRMDGSAAGSPVVAAGTVHWAIYLLALQVLVNIVAGYFFGSFMVVGRAHVGGYWGNFKALLLFGVTVTLVWLHASFAVLALAQLLCVAAALLAAMVHLRAMAPQIFPTLRYWDGGSVPLILGQSGYFALLWSSNWFLYQVPVLILQSTVGPVEVVVFSIMRTIFSMTRNQMNALSEGMGPEITRLYGSKNWGTLAQMYDHSERLIFSLIPVVNMGVLFASPLLLEMWIHGRNGRALFSPMPYLICAGISIAMSIKMHKFLFQFSTNTHRELARFSVGCYILLDLAWLWLVPRYSLYGLLWAWLAVELAQVFYIVRLNMKLFAPHVKLELKYLARLLLFSAAVLALATQFLPAIPRLPYAAQAAIALALGGVLLLADFPLFHLLPVLKVFLHHLRHGSGAGLSEAQEQE